MPELIDNRYEIISTLGSGGMADVYLARDRHLERSVAIKILDQRLARDAEFVARFRREARAAAGLSHPNIVNIHDRGDTGDSYYIAMEYLEGETLKDIIDGEGRLPQDEAVRITLMMLDALQFAHERGVIHRDIKPQNIVISRQGQVKVTDFGIAKTADLTTRVTTTGSILGTAQYLSPEQASGQEVGAASDIYSAGVVLYEMLTGRVPFQGDSLMAVVMKHREEQPVPPRELNPEIAPDLEAVVLKSLSKTVQGRFHSAYDFSRDLKHTSVYRKAAGAGGSAGTAVPGAPASADTGRTEIVKPANLSRPDTSGTRPGSDEPIVRQNMPQPPRTPPAPGKPLPWATVILPVAAILLFLAVGTGIVTAFIFNYPGGDKPGEPVTTASRTVTDSGGGGNSGGGSRVLNDDVQQYVNSVDSLLLENDSLEQQIISAANEINSVAPYGITDSLLLSISNLESSVQTIRSQLNSLSPPEGFSTAHSEFDWLLYYNIIRCNALYRGAYAWAYYNYEPQYSEIFSEGQQARASYDELYPVFADNYAAAKAGAS